MSQIENYEQYCRAFHEDADNKSKSDAELLLYVQNWIIRILDFVEEDAMDFSLKKLLAENADKSFLRDSKEDALSSIIDDTELAFRYIVDHMREKIIRENVRVPVHKVREINGYGLNWLGRQSGNTIKQKISSAGNSVMALQRRMSLDTGENRLFVAFAKEVYNLLEIKLDNNVPCRDREKAFYSELSAFLHGADIREIKRWENFAPNNTLLSDQNYKKIWNGWNGLKKLDDLVKADSDCMDIRLTTIFFVELLTQTREFLRIPQMPVEVDYDSFQIHLGDQVIYGLDQKNCEVTVRQENNCVYVKRAGKECRALIEDKKLIIYADGQVVSEYAVTIGSMAKCVRLFLIKTGIGTERHSGMESSPGKRKYSNVIMDFFSLHPQFIGDFGAVEKMPGRMLQQDYSCRNMDGNARVYHIPCDKTNAIKMAQGITETYTVSYAADHGSMEQMKRLMHMMENHISTDNITFITPDALNEFQLSMIHKAVRMAYRNVKNIPRSIGVAFDFQATEAFEVFSPGDFLLIADLIDDEITFTLIEGKYNEQLVAEIPESKGIVWERHPSFSLSCKEEVDNRIIDPLIKAGCIEGEKIYRLMGLEGLYDEAGKLSFFFGEGNWFEAGREALPSVRFNITEEIARFINRHRSIMGSSKVHVISMAEQFIIKGYKTVYRTKADALNGCLRLEKLQAQTDILLWHDHLPDLAIKLMYGKFDLVKNMRIEPRFNIRQAIEIVNTFTLPGGCKEYHFRLVQDNRAGKVQYEAVIKNSAFPLKENTDCKLRMTYQYGAEEPYELVFVPTDPGRAGFVEAKVSWSKLEEYPYMDLDSPEFPYCMTWDELKTHPGKHGGTINVYDELKRQYHLIKEGHGTCDVSAYPVKRDKQGNRRGIFPYEIHGETVTVSWNERNWEKGAEKPENINVISFLLDEDTRKAERYRIRDLMSARVWTDDLWFRNKRGAYQCIVSLEYKNREREIAIYENNFDDSESFWPGINDVSFEVNEISDGKLVAVNVHDESRSEYEAPKKYIAWQIHGGKTPPRHLINPYFGKWTRMLFANNRSLADRECPLDFRQAFAEIVKDWVGLFDQYENKKDKYVIFTCLSLGARNIGKDYFAVADRALEMYRQGEMEIPPEIGCALGDLSQQDERGLLKAICFSVQDRAELIGILSKALWHDENFVYNADRELLLTENFQASIKYITAVIDNKGSAAYSLKDWEKARIRTCLEYILGVLRLRKINDPMINKQYLSLNNSRLQDLYRCVESMADNNVEIHSFLKLEISNKGPYKQICDLLYVFLVYLTGQNAEGEIKISGILDQTEVEGK